MREGDDEEREGARSDEETASQERGEGGRGGERGEERECVVVERVCVSLPSQLFGGSDGSPSLFFFAE
jgi:hypothetical protein